MFAQNGFGGDQVAKFFMSHFTIKLSFIIFYNISCIMDYI